MAAVDDDLVDEEFPPLENNMRNLMEQKTLQWIFVGGKGGVGKTTTSCSVASQLAKCRDSVLIISTDPAHNLSDAFGQKFGPKPTLVDGFNNLYALEIDPPSEVQQQTGTLDSDDSTSLVAELASSIPGIDEAMSFAEIMRQVKQMNFSVIVFDTAPTGHTLRLLSFPELLQKGFAKIMSLKQKFSGIFQQVQNMVSTPDMPSEDQILAKLEETKKTIDEVHKQFQNPDLTTFVCVCIPEFLSLFETERLVQELAKFGIDSRNIVVNQVLMPEKDSSCKKCQSRVRMQRKYLDQIRDLYEEDFHVVTMPLLDEEVRGPKDILKFSQMLLDPPVWDSVADNSSSSSSSGAK